MICNLCPRNCNALRTDTKGGGLCGMPALPVAARAALHQWEEPPISGTRGSGTLFFSGCSLQCVFCQNEPISHQGRGKAITPEHLRALCFQLIDQGAHNINFVTPTHYTHVLLDVLREPLPVPVVYNCGGYESVHTVAFLRKKVQCWLPDLKYYDAEISGKYSDAPDYFERASAAIEQMFKETGPYVIGADGILQRGVLIRHLILPGQVEDTKRILEYVAETFEPGDVLFSLMRQYTPCGRAAEFPEIDRRITDEEYEACESYMEELGIIDGYVQQKESAEAAFIPAFDGTGVLKS